MRIHEIISQILRSIAPFPLYYSILVNFANIFKITGVHYIFTYMYHSVCQLGKFKAIFGPMPKKFRQFTYITLYIFISFVILLVIYIIFIFL